jgi:hypothetical protein
MIFFHKNKKSNRIYGGGNVIVLADGKTMPMSKIYIPNLTITCVGNNNIIKIFDLSVFRENCDILISNGDNCLIEIESCFNGLGNLSIKMGYGSHQKIFIGKNTTCNGTNIYAYIDNAELRIENNCMLSTGIEYFYPTDM